MLENKPINENSYVATRISSVVNNEGISNNSIKLPSRFQLNDIVKLNLEAAGTITNCNIIKVHFTEGKVLYDLEVRVPFQVSNNEEWHYSARIYNIDSAFLEPID